MAQGTRLVDHPTSKDHYLVQHVADVDGEKVVAMEVAVPRTLGIAAAIKRGEYLMGEWLLTGDESEIASWLTDLRGSLQSHLSTLKARRLKHFIDTPPTPHPESKE